ncbi:replication protein C, IncQ-type [Ferrovibrio sp.]|uniref:replication protein C, IncQ-type n=1 Tax=Ferrovibrio sp. TaxID=1917215 RepID=UPI003918C20F
MDRMHCVADGLFLNYERGLRDQLKLKIRHPYGAENWIEFYGPDPLNAVDLRVFQILIALASDKNYRGPLDYRVEEALRDALYGQIPFPNDRLVSVRCSHRDIAREFGYRSAAGKAFSKIRDCIERLAKVTVIDDQAGQRKTSKLLSTITDKKTKAIAVCLNPRMARVILNASLGGYTRIDLTEARALSDPALLAHMRICAWLSPGRTHQLSIATLCGYIWPATNSATAVRNRLRKARKVMEEIGSLPGWHVIAGERDNSFEITRPKALQNRKEVSTFGHAA